MRIPMKQAGRMAAAIFFAAGCAICEAAAVPLSLSESVEMALASDESIDAAAAGKNTAQWQRSAARRASGFNIGWRSGAYRIGGPDYDVNRARYSLGLSDDPYEHRFTNSVSAEFPLYTGGRIENTVKARCHSLSSADLTLENTKQVVKFQTTEAYYNVLQQKNLVRVAESAVRMSGEQLSLIENVCKSARRKQDLNIDQLFKEVNSLYRLDQIEVIPAEDAGDDTEAEPAEAEPVPAQELPDISKALLIAIPAIWVLIGLYTLWEKKKGRGKK